MWSIGIYAGESPFQLLPHPRVANPVLTAGHVTDVSAEFVADPFMIRRDGTWHMFFEVMNRQTQRGEIGLAQSEDGLDWSYRQIVLAEPFHLSYPYVFEWEGEHYMIPETLGANAVRLYRATRFPTEWACAGALFEGTFADPSIFHFEDHWWLFACSTPYRHDTLRLFRAGELSGAWTEHPASPIVEEDKRSARPGGRVLVKDHRVTRFSQVCFPSYGSQVRAFEIRELAGASYREEEHPHSPVLRGSGRGWNAVGMHHVDPHPLADGRWLACVDGLSELPER
ncbi:MAG TPA: hypothetical protein VD861_18735 [Pyrinomonadaceae bacterium]|jgi:hypothetical protein|nr:hypothetical protein [Pyrinomonadaceae bacterium]